MIYDGYAIYITDKEIICQKGPPRFFTTEDWDAMSSLIRTWERIRLEQEKEKNQVSNFDEAFLRENGLTMNNEITIKENLNNNNQ